jgi:hypothetical protein
MNKAVWLASALVTIVLTRNPIAQGPSTARQAEEAARSRVNAAMERLKDQPLDPEEETRFWRGEDTLTESVTREVDGPCGYREQADGRFQFVSKSTDFEGRTMMVRELRSPFADEIWFLAWGRVHSKRQLVLPGGVRLRWPAVQGLVAS